MLLEQNTAKCRCLTRIIAVCVIRLAEFNPAILTAFRGQVKLIIMRGLKDKDMKVRLAGLRACTSLLLSLPEKDRVGLQECVPLLFEVLGSAFSEADDETLVAAVTVLSEVAGNSPKFLKAHLQPILQAMVHMVACAKLEAETRRVAMGFLLTLVEEGKGMVRKQAEFAKQVVPLAFGLVQELQHTAEWDRPGEKEGDDDDGQDNFKFGCECINRLAHALGGKLFLSVIYPLLERAFADKEHWNVRHAALLSIAHMAGGVDKHLEPQLGNIMKNLVVPTALNDPHPRVRWAAVDVCAYLSEAFEPDFCNTFTEQVFTVLMACTAPNNHWRVISHACLCFPDFCRGLESEKLMPYMPKFLTAMVACLGMSAHTQIVENALAAVSSVAMVAEKEFIPYYAHFMPGVKGLITTATAENQKGVRGKAIECIGMMAQSVGSEVFGPEVAPVMEALLPSDDTQHQHVVSTMARICRVIGRAFAPYLPRVIPPLIASARIEDACVILPEGEANPYQNRDGYKTASVDVRQNGMQQISINSTLLEEKSRAIRMLFEYANTMGATFFPYVDEVARILVPCVRYQFESNVRTNSVMSLAPLLRCANEALAADPARRQAYASQLLNFMWPVVVEGINVEYELDALCDILGEWADVLEALPAGVVLTGAQLEEMNEVMRRLIIDCLERCQKRDEVAHGEDMDEAEQELIDAENQHEDEFLGYVYQVVNRLVKNNPAQYPETFHEKLHPVLNAMIQSDDVSLRTSAICMIAQVMEDCPANPRSVSYAMTMHQACTKSLTVDDVGLKQSAAFGFGVCAMVAQGNYAPHALGIMRQLADMVDEAAAAERAYQAKVAKAAAAGRELDEDFEDMSLATDNALGAMVKIFVFTYNRGLPVNGVQTCPQEEVCHLMTRWVSNLPCSGDLVEAKKIHSLLAELLAASNPLLLGPQGRNLPLIVGAMSGILGRADWEEICQADTRQRLIELFHGMQKQMPEGQMKAILAAVTPQQREAIKPFVIHPALLV
jgi:hypothetical protein